MQVVLMKFIPTRVHRGSSCRGIVVLGRREPDRPAGVNLLLTLIVLLLVIVKIFGAFLSVLARCESTWCSIGLGKIIGNEVLLVLLVLI